MRRKSAIPVFMTHRVLFQLQQTKTKLLTSLQISTDKASSCLHVTSSLGLKGRTSFWGKYLRKETPKRDKLLLERAQKASALLEDLTAPELDAMKGPTARWAKFYDKAKHVVHLNFEHIMTCPSLLLQQ